MTDPTFRAGFDATLETAINTALRYDPGSRARLAKLAGKVLRVDLTAPALTLFLAIDDEDGEEGGYIEVHSRWSGEVTTELSGSALAFVQLLRNRDATPAKLGVEVRGSSALLAELQAIMRNLDIDWEEPLAKLIGDSPAHQLGSGVRMAASWLKDALGAAPKAGAEAVSEEWRVTPPQAQFEAFAEDVAEFAQGVDRLEARVDILRRKLERRNQPDGEGK
ncbi:SCP2 sterol-binding domain-containing protein [Microbulbifer salipaludis]|uniref:Ubiquinone biosynthesis accessory factor UbiJ n=1 Tax=Microbulbifer salipaludis TaxID=187980 RepID=A0ABS3E3C2_9GAMM|nr:SCP2 sterol-binding domain-containing protein [Microbulbifer salipaludis]MBN8429718.1 SCP2 sterol-binding domain-containing protein [Microbulbifer salipaludis]